MKKVYTGLKAEKIDFGAYDMATYGSVPAGCIEVVANTLSSDGSTCTNPESTTLKMWVLNRPAGWD